MATYYYSLKKVESGYFSEAIPILVTGTNKNINQKIHENIAPDKLWMNSEEITLEFNLPTNNIYLNFLDYYEWDSGNPGGCTIVVSEKMKNILDKFIIPLHKWYDLRIENQTHDIKKIFQEKNRYYILHLEDGSIKALNFQQSQFKISPLSRKRGNQDTELLPVGYIPSVEIFQELNKKEVINNRLLKLVKAVYKGKYDIIYGRGKIVINEKVKQAIELAGVGREQGLEMPEFTDYQIEILVE
jgi:hypothetical protein